MPFTSASSRTGTEHGMSVSCCISNKDQFSEHGFSKEPYYNQSKEYCEMYACKSFGMLPLDGANDLL